MPKVCGACGADGATKQCSACQRAWYCDRNCQKGAWKTHKKACKKVAAAAAAQATGAKKSPAFPADQQREMVRARRAIQKMGLLMNYKGLANAAGRLCDQERLLPDDFSKSIQDMDRLYACTVGLAALMMRPRVMSNWAMEEAVDGKVARGPLQIDLIGSRLGNEGMMDFAMLVQVLEEAFDGFGRFRGLVVRLIGPQMDFRADPDAAAAYRAGVARAVAQVGDRMADSRFSPLKITQVVKLYHDTNPDDKGRLAVALNAGLMAGFKTWAPTIAFCKQHGIPLAVTGYSSCHLDEAVETAKVFDDLGALITQPPVRNPFRVEMGRGYSPVLLRLPPPPPFLPPSPSPPSSPLPPPSTSQLYCNSAGFYLSWHCPPWDKPFPLSVQSFLSRR